MRAISARSPGAGAKWRSATPVTAAVRSAVIGPPSRIATGRPVSGSFTTTTALIAAMPFALFAPNPATHFMPTRSSAPELPRRWAGIACANESGGRGWTPIFGGSSLRPGLASAVIVSSARRSRSSIGGMDARTSAALNQRSGGRAGATMVGRPDTAGIVGGRPHGYDSVVATIDIAQSLENLKLERDAIALYDALAGIEKDRRRAEAFRTIAGNERRHADVWANKLRQLGANVPEPTGPRLRIRTIVLFARLFGTHAVRDLVLALEGDEEDLYTAQGSPEVDAIAADEREHAAIWERLSDRGRSGHASRVPGRSWRGSAGTALDAPGPSERSSSGCPMGSCRISRS